VMRDRREVADRGLFLAEARGGDRRRLGHGPRACPPAGGAGLLRARGLPAPEQMSDAQLGELIPAEAQAKLIEAGRLPKGAPADELRQMLVRMNANFRDKAPLSAADAATVILDGVRSGAWRILVGDDARKLDAAVRAKPGAAYDYAELFSLLAEQPTAGSPER